MTVDVPAALSNASPSVWAGRARAWPRPSGCRAGPAWRPGPSRSRARAGREDLILRRRSAPFDPENARSISLATEAALIQATGARGAPRARRAPRLRRGRRPGRGLCHGPGRRRDAGPQDRQRPALRRRAPASSPASAARCWSRSTRRRRRPGLDLKTVDGVGELDRYEEVYRATGAERPILELAFQYLRRHVPAPVEPVLLHGDFRNGNLMFDPRDGRGRGARLGALPHRRSGRGHGLDLHQLLALRPARPAGGRLRRLRRPAGRLRRGGRAAHRAFAACGSGRCWARCAGASCA